MKNIQTRKEKRHPTHPQLRARARRGAPGAVGGLGVAFPHVFVYIFSYLGLRLIEDSKELGTWAQTVFSDRGCVGLGIFIVFLKMNNCFP